MKVERKNKAFEPVTITLETQDELNYLWHALNVSRNHVMKASSEMYLVSDDFSKHYMWNVIDNIMNE